MDRLFLGRIEKGFGKPERFTPVDPVRFQTHLRSLLDNEVEVIIRKHRKTRSGEQNRYHHGCVIPLLAEHCGYEMEEMKDALKFKFLRTHDDGNLPTVRRTRDLTTAEMTNFIEQCRRLGAEMGCVIPSPGEVEF